MSAALQRLFSLHPYAVHVRLTRHKQLHLDSTVSSVFAHSVVVKFIDRNYPSTLNWFKLNLFSAQYTVLKINATRFGWGECFVIVINLSDKQHHSMDGVLLWTVIQWRRQDFVTGGSEVGSIGGLEFEVPQSRLYCLCINVAHCSTALQCICRVIPKKFHDNESTHILHNFWTSTHRGKLPSSPPGGATAVIGLGNRQST